MALIANTYLLFDEKIHISIEYRLHPYKTSFSGT